jgi:hypothetical protein
VVGSEWFLDHCQIGIALPYFPAGRGHENDWNMAMCTNSPDRLNSVTRAQANIRGDEIGTSPGSQNQRIFTGGGDVKRGESGAGERILDQEGDPGVLFYDQSVHRISPDERERLALSRRSSNDFPAIVA